MLNETPVQNSQIAAFEEVTSDYGVRDEFQEFVGGDVSGEPILHASEYAWLLAPDSERDGGKPSPPYRRDFISMAQFAEALPAGYNDLASQIEEMGSHMLGYVRGPVIKSAWRYISDVILYRTNEQLQELVSILRLYGRTRRNGMFGFSVESDHIHVIHDCAFTGSHCRDVWRRQIEPVAEFGPTRTENKPIWKFTRTDWYDVFIYFFLRKRGTREIWIRGENWKAPTDGKIYIL